MNCIPVMDVLTLGSTDWKWKSLGSYSKYRPIRLRNIQFIPQAVPTPLLYNVHISPPLEIVLESVQPARPGVQGRTSKVTPA